MKKALIVGVNGFAGKALRRELTETGTYDVVGADVFSTDDSVIAVDMTDPAASEKLIADTKPDIIFNLAGQASPMISWEKVNFTMKLNVDLSVNILEAVRKHCPEARMLFIGSANQYDLNALDCPEVGEDAPIVNNSPYSVSKNAQEALLKLMAKKYGLDVLFTRSFNHIGPEQRTGFVVTDYTDRIVKLEKGEMDTFTYGNLDSWRDFSDVRDVVRAYRLIAEKGVSGKIYNVGSGKSFYIRDLIGYLVEKSEAASTKTTLPVRLPDDELVHYRADITELTNDTGFEPQCDLWETLDSILVAFRNK